MPGAQEEVPQVTVPRLGGVWVWNGAAWSCAHGAKRHCLSPPPGLSFMPLQIWSKALAISGILTMGLALLGCVGALKEFRCLLGLVSAPSPSIPRLIHILPSNRALAAPSSCGGIQPDLSTLPLPSILGHCCSCLPHRSPWESSSPLRRSR